MNNSVVRQQICDIGYKLWLLGFTPFNAGNICVKVGDDEYLATPTMVGKGAMTPDMILKINSKLEVLESFAPYKLTSEIRIHIRALQVRARHGAIASIHTHAPYCQLYSVLGTPIIEQGSEFVGPPNIPCVPYEKPGTQELAESIVPALETVPYAIMGKHGPITVGASLDEAFMLMEMMEHSAKVAYLLHQYKR